MSYCACIINYLLWDSSRWSCVPCINLKWVKLSFSFSSLIPATFKSNKCWSSLVVPQSGWTIFQYCSTGLCNNGYHRHFHMAIISLMQYIAAYCTIGLSTQSKYTSAILKYFSSVTHNKIIYVADNKLHLNTILAIITISLLAIIVILYFNIVQPYTSVYWREIKTLNTPGIFLQNSSTLSLVSYRQIHNCMPYSNTVSKRVNWSLSPNLWAICITT